MGLFKRFMGRFNRKENSAIVGDDVIMHDWRGFPAKKKKDKEILPDKPSAMYEMLDKDEYKKYPYGVDDLGEGMAIVKQVLSGYWKPRFLIDRTAKRAIEFMDVHYRLRTVDENDVDWESLAGLPEKAVNRAKGLSFYYPSSVRKYCNGVAEVSWQLNPDGYYYMDSDGFGMTDDREVTVYGFIDRAGKVVVPFKHVKNYAKVTDMRERAESIVAKRMETAHDEPAEKNCKGCVKIYNLIIIDESGSMRSIRKPAIDSVNETLQTIASAQLMHSEQEHYVTLVSFNGNVKTIHDCVHIDNVREIDENDYVPNGITALYDAMGTSVNRLRGQAGDGDKVIVTIVTDGYENASREYRGPAIRELVQEMRKKGWVFAYIGANHDVEAAAESMAIKSSMRFTADGCGTEMMSRRVNQVRCEMYSSIADNSFSAELANADFFGMSKGENENKSGERR